MWLSFFGFLKINTNVSIPVPADCYWNHSREQPPGATKKLLKAFFKKNSNISIPVPTDSCRRPLAEASICSD